MSKHPYTPPLIAVQYDMDADHFILTATSHSRTMPAGPRILRSEPFPALQFQHATEEAANADAKILREYLEECASGKRKDVGPTSGRRGWWE